MKKFIAIALLSALSANVFAVSFVQTVASPFLTVAASLEATIATPFLSTAASMGGAKEVAVAAQVKQEIAEYEVSAELGYALEAMVVAYQAKYDVNVDDAVAMIEFNANDVLSR